MRTRTNFVASVARDFVIFIAPATEKVDERGRRAFIKLLAEGLSREFDAVFRPEPRGVYVRIYRGVMPDFAGNITFRTIASLEAEVLQAQERVTRWIRDQRPLGEVFEQWHSYERERDRKWRVPTYFDWPALSEPQSDIRTRIEIPLSRELRAALDADVRRDHLLRGAIFQHFAARTDEVINAVEVRVVRSHLVLGSADDLAIDVARVILSSPRGRSQRLIDAWITPWAPIAGIGTLLLTVLGLLVCWIPVSQPSSYLLAIAVLAVCEIVALVGRAKGARVSAVLVGLAPAVTLWAFAIFYANFGDITWKTSPTTWVDPVLLSLSVATGSYLDYEVGGSVVIRVATLIEMLFALTILGGTLYGIAQTILSAVRTQRDREG